MAVMMKQMKVVEILPHHLTCAARTSTSPPANIPVRPAGRDPRSRVRGERRGGRHQRGGVRRGREAPRRTTDSRVSSTEESTAFACPFSPSLARSPRPLRASTQSLSSFAELPAARHPCLEVLRSRSLMRSLMGGGDKSARSSQSTAVDRANVLACVSCVRPLSARCG